MGPRLFYRLAFLEEGPRLSTGQHNWGGTALTVLEGVPHGEKMGGDVSSTLALPFVTAPRGGKTRQ